MSDETAAGTRRRGPSPVTVLAIASLGAAVAFVDATIVNIAFPNIAKSFPGTSISSLSWILNAYNIVFAAFLVAAGRIADLLGRRRIFIFGLELFTAASVLCAVAPSVGLLVAFRVIQALGAAFLVPASLALVLNAFPPERRSHGVALLSAVAAAAAGLGPSLGGVLVAAADWRLVFLVNLPIGVAAVLLARRRLVESRTPGRRRMPDVLGALLFALAIASLVLGVVKGQEWGWGSPRIVTAFAVAVVLGAIFLRRCSHHRSPIIDLSLLRSRTFTAANAMTIVVAAGFYGYTLTNVLFLTGVWRYSVLQAGLALTPGPFVAAAVAGPTSRLVARIGPRPVLVVGGLIWGAAVLWFVNRAGLTPQFLSVWLPGIGAARHRRRDRVPQSQRGGGGVSAGGQLRHRDRAQLRRPAARSGARGGHRRGDHRHALAARGGVRVQGCVDVRLHLPHGRRARLPAGRPPAKLPGAPGGGRCAGRSG